ISLSTWLRDYLYISLGGNRKGKVRTYINLFLTMLLGGLWHGANWTFILWGAWHGIILAIERFLGVNPEAPASIGRRAITMATTLIAVMIGWVLFRAHNLSAAVDFYAGMVGANGIGISDNYSWQIKGNSLTALACGIALTFAQPYFNKKREPVTLSKGSVAMKTIPSLAYQLAVAALFIVAVSRLIAMSYSPFLYFQF
ncbi:MAG TPA: MBOAT family O-acyltransferase, partial [Micavibrio sp.]